jgi:hypothetical protein
MVQVKDGTTGEVLGHVQPDGKTPLHQLVGELAGDADIVNMRLRENNKGARAIPMGNCAVGAGVGSIVYAKTTFYAWLEKRHGTRFAQGLQQAVERGLVPVPGCKHTNPWVIGYRDDAYPREGETVPVEIAGSCVLNYVSGDEDWAPNDLDLYIAVGDEDYYVEDLAARCLDALGESLAPGAYPKATVPDTPSVYDVMDGVACVVEVRPATQKEGDRPLLPKLQMIVLRPGDSLLKRCPSPGLHAVSMYDLDILRSYVDASGVRCAPKTLRCITARSGGMRVRRLSDLWRFHERIAKYRARGYGTLVPSAPTIQVHCLTTLVLVWALCAALHGIDDLTAPAVTIRDQLARNFAVPYVPDVRNFELVAARIDNINRDRYHPERSETEVTFRRVANVDALCDSLVACLERWRGREPELSKTWSPHRARIAMAAPLPSVQNMRYNALLADLTEICGRAGVGSGPFVR